MLGRGSRSGHGPGAAWKRGPAGRRKPYGEKQELGRRGADHGAATPPNGYPVILQDGCKVRLDRLSSFPDFGYVKLFKDGSGTLHGREGEEIVGFFNIRELQQISESRVGALGRYVTHLAGPAQMAKAGGSYQPFGPMQPEPQKAKKMKMTFPVVSHQEAEAAMGMLAYFDAFTSVNLNRDGSGTLRNFNESVLEHFDDVAGLHAVLTSHAMKERLRGAEKL